MTTTAKERIVAGMPDDPAFQPGQKREPRTYPRLLPSALYQLTYRRDAMQIHSLRSRRLVVGLTALGIATSLPTPAAPPYLHAPAINEYAKHDPYGLTVLPDGRFLKPAGRCFPVGTWPTGIAVSPQGEKVFVASDNIGQFVWNYASPDPAIIAFSPGARPSADVHYTEGDPVYSPGGQELYWSSADKGGIYVVDALGRSLKAEIPVDGELNGRKYQDSFVIDLKLSPDGKYLYGADLANFRVVIIDVAKRKMVGSIDVGLYPYALAVSGNRVFVANIGNYAYSVIPPPTQPGFDPRGLTFPPFGVPSNEAREGVDLEGRHVPGLGDPNSQEAFSVWGIDVSDPANPQVVSRYKPGILIGGKADSGTAVGGSAPNYLVVHGNRLYISDDNNDTIEALDLTTGKQVMKTVIRPSPLVAKLRGVGPRGMVVSKDGSRLYVAEMGINAVGVIDTASGKVLGHIPTAWYPYRVALSNDGKKLFTICFRGFGCGPRGIKNLPADPFIGVRDPVGPGALNVIDVPSAASLPGMTKDVLAYNGIVDRSADRAAMTSPVVPTTPGKASEQIKHVVFIIKENHTFDTIFDRIPGTSNDPSLLHWGLHQTITQAGQPTLTDVPVMPNHNALARQFALSDNYYVEPEGSGVGHRWMVGVMPNNFCQMTYTLRWKFQLESPAPGRRASFGGNSSIAPEDYPEAGTMWDNFARHNTAFRNYGEGFEFAGVGEDDKEQPTGARETVNIPMEKALFDNTCREFPIFNMSIPDQYRADWFIKDFTNRFITGGKDAPAFICLALCSDHGDDADASHGYPYHASWMVDNDLALGRIVEFLSHTKYWKNMAIFVTQDDAGSEYDHIDAQRSVLLAMSPWIKHHYVSHRHTTVTSIHRTVYELLGLPPLSMMDALANDFSDFFTTVPDFTPYTHKPIELRLFDPEKAKDPKDPEYQVARKRPSIQMDDPRVVRHLADDDH
jgi:YVTN family beta-propeller protein